LAGFNVDLGLYMKAVHCGKESAVRFPCAALDLSTSLSKDRCPGR
jgi:hypothetical protein